MSPEGEVSRLRARVRELEEELAEWRRTYVAPPADDPDVARQGALMAAFGLTRTEAAVVLALAEAAPRTLSHGYLRDVIEAAAPCAPRSGHSNALHVHMVRIRRKLRAWHLPIANTLGVGFAIDGLAAERILRVLRPEAA